LSVVVLVVAAVVDIVVVAVVGIVGALLVVGIQADFEHIPS
jgi:hypothetical protein